MRLACSKFCSRWCIERKKDLDDKLDAIIKKPKAKKKRRGGDEEVR